MLFKRWVAVEFAFFIKLKNKVELRCTGLASEAKHLLEALLIFEHCLDEHVADHTGCELNQLVEVLVALVKKTTLFLLFCEGLAGLAEHD